MQFSRSNTYDTAYQTDEDDEDKETDGGSTMYTFDSDDDDGDEQRDDVDGSSSIGDRGTSTFDETVGGESYSVVSIGDDTFQDILDSEKAVDESFPSMFMVLPSSLLMAGGDCRPVECNGDGDSFQQGTTDEEDGTTDDEDGSTDCDTYGDNTVDFDKEEKDDGDQTVEDIHKVHSTDKENSSYNPNDLTSFEYFDEDNQEGLAGDDGEEERNSNTDKKLTTLDKSIVSKEGEEPTSTTKSKKKEGKRRNFVKVSAFVMSSHQKIQRIIARRKRKKNKKRLMKEESMASDYKGVQEAEVELQFEDVQDNAAIEGDDNKASIEVREERQEENTQDDHENDVIVVGDVTEDRDGVVLEGKEAREEEEDNDVEDRNDLRVWSKHDTRNGENVELHVKDDSVIMVEIDDEKAEVSCPMLSSNGKRDTNGFWFDEVSGLLPVLQGCVVKYEVFKPTMMKTLFCQSEPTAVSSPN